MNTLALVLISCLLGLPAHADQLIAHIEVLSSHTSVATSAGYCVQDVNPYPSYNFIQTARNVKGYECDVSFTAASRDGGRNVGYSGTRSVDYTFTPYVSSRNSLRSQSSYLSQYAPPGALTYDIPKTVFGLFDDSSTANEEHQIAVQMNQATPTDASIDHAARAACFVAFLEVLNDACSDAQLGQIRQGLLARAAEGGFINVTQFQNLGGSK